MATQHSTSDPITISKPQQTVEAGAQLRRALSVWGAAAFVITSMIGTGIFTVPAEVRAAAGNGVAALGVWITGAALALFGAFCYAEWPRECRRRAASTSTYRMFTGARGHLSVDGSPSSPVSPRRWPPRRSTRSNIFRLSRRAGTRRAVDQRDRVTQGEAVAALLPLLLAFPIQSASSPAARCKRRWP